jgi:YHS domain-containing protein
MKNSFVFSILLMLVFSACSSTAQNILTDKNKVAVSGYDVVSYFSGTPLKGKNDLTTEHEGATYRFATAENRDIFKASPAKYTPQYGGWCAWGWSQGYPAKIDPKAWTIVDGKLYLNYNAQVKVDWDKDQTGFIKKADVNFANRKNKK